MQEVLSKPEDTSKPLREQVFFVLHLVDFHESWEPRFVVEESRMAWREIDGQFIGEGTGTDALPTLEGARTRYEARRLALVNRGFVLSDMDF